MKKIANQTGASLIEVMVALLILAVGLLGVLSMQSRALQLNQNAYLYSQAAILANDIMEAMRTSSSLGPYIQETNTAPDCTDSTEDCSPAQIANWNMVEWRNNISSLLPDGEGVITQIVDGGDLISEYEIKVSFRIGNDEITNAPVRNEVILRTSI